jgi:putative Mg2+ transporter-C (MgtC) family protein
VLASGKEKHWMTIAFAHFAQPFNFSWLQQVVVVNGAIGRLLMACLLGGLIGLEREISRKAAGVRTNLLICMGAAFFTLLSAVLAGDANPDKGRVASNIVQGIGFLGAGLILHNRSRVSGLTSAASVFVVASIGMACGAGLYAAAAVAAVIVIVALELVGFLERRGNLKGYPLMYEARGRDQTLMLASILDAMDKTKERLTGVEHDAIGDLQRVSFSVTATNKQHERLHGQLIAEPAIDALFTFRDPEED